MGDSQSQNKRWVIVFLIYADFLREQTLNQVNTEFLEDLDSLCKDLIKCKIDGKKFSLYVVLSKVNYLEDNNNNNEFLPFSSTFLYRLEPSAEGKNKVIVQELENIQDIDISVQRTKDLEIIFQKIKQSEKKQGYDDIRIFLNTWDHGSAFGIFGTGRQRNPPTQMHTWDIIDNSTFYYIKEFLDATKQKFRSMNRNATITPVGNAKNSYSFLDMVFSIDDEETDRAFNTANATNFTVIKKAGKDMLRMEFLGNEIKEIPITILNEVLSNKELAVSIANGFEQKADILMMMNCWMMNLDAMCLFKEDVDYFIAPSTGIIPRVYNYSKILEFIYEETRKNGYLEAETLAKTCITSILDETRTLISRDINSCAVFGVALNKEKADVKKRVIDLIVEAIKEFMDSLPINSKNEKLKLLLKYATIYTHDFSDQKELFQIDFFHWVKNIKFTKGNGEIAIKESVFRKFFRQMDELIPMIHFCKHVGPSWYEGNGSKGMIHNKPVGLNVYLPAKDFSDRIKHYIDTYIRPKQSGDGQRKDTVSEKKAHQKGFYSMLPQWAGLIEFITEPPREEP